jgi:hypothetical protein
VNEEIAKRFDQARSRWFEAEICADIARFTGNQEMAAQYLREASEHSTEALDLLLLYGDGNGGVS